MDDHSTNPDVARIAESLVEWAASGAQIINHMTGPGHNPNAPQGPLETLERLLRGTLEPLAERHGDLTAAADVLADAVRTIGEELFLVDPMN